MAHVVEPRVLGYGFADEMRAETGVARELIAYAQEVDAGPDEHVANLVNGAVGVRQE